MIRKPGGVGRTASRPSGADLGCTLSETIVVVFLVGIVTAIVVNSVQNSIERARMASCMNELRGIQAALWYDSDGGNKAIDPKTFWDTHYSGTKPGPYVLLLDTGNAGDVSAAPVRHRVPVAIPRVALATEPPLISPLRRRLDLL